MRHVAVYGGSFNPFAKHHQDIIRFLVEERGFNTVLVVPSAAHALKSNLIEYMHRFNMTKLGVDDLIFNGIPTLPFESSVRVKPIEMEMLREQPGPIRTYDVLRKLRKGFLENDVEMKFAIGPDIQDELNQWAHVDKIKSEFGFVEIPIQSMRATKLRKMMKEGVESWKRYVPPAVERYIQMHNLYGSNHKKETNALSM